MNTKQYLLQYLLSDKSLRKFATEGMPEKIRNSRTSLIRFKLDTLVRNLGRRYAPNGPLETFWDTASYVKKHYKEEAINAITNEINKEETLNNSIGE